MDNRFLIDRLRSRRALSPEEWLQLIAAFTPEDREYAAQCAREETEARFGKKIYFRGIVEFTNICRCDCLYCGIRRSNACASRYRLTAEEILECCREGYDLGYRTFVLQGGEDAWWTDERLCALVEEICSEYPDCAITLSVGERSRESYERLRKSGAARYLLRHETADAELYKRLHPEGQRLENRLRCLRDLKELGYQTGCGMMVGAPYQTDASLVRDMLFMCDFKPQMVGMGPFIPHCDTPLRSFPAGSAEKTLMLLSLTRLMLPNVLLPSTTALGSLSGDGRQRGVLAGCNVVMPNLSPISVRKKYMLYDNKSGTGLDAIRSLEALRRQMREIGREVVCARGDYKGEE